MDRLQEGRAAQPRANATTHSVAGATADRRPLFVLVPSLVPTGPVKGAIALANALANHCEVSLVAIKPGHGAQAEIHPAVRVIAPLSHSGWWRSVRAYRALLIEARGDNRVASVSFCFSADMLNAMCSDLAMTCASVRGNLPQNYRHDYGWTGLLLAWVHLLFLRRVQSVAAMSKSMARQVERFIGRAPEVIPNFIDETPLDGLRVERTVASGPFRFCYVGSLSTRKRPQALIEAVARLHRSGESVRLDVIGEGTLRRACERSVQQAGITQLVRFHGQLADPFRLLASADCMVLPSLSEGISRAVLESLHLGVPVVSRLADGNDELIRLGHNGALFRRDEELPQLMLDVARWSRARSDPGQSLLPAAFRQRECAKQYFDLIAQQTDGWGRTKVPAT